MTDLLLPEAWTVSSNGSLERLRRSDRMSFRLVSFAEQNGPACAKKPTHMTDEQPGVELGGRCGRAGRRVHPSAWGRS
jgi:hypothetical protein